MQYLAEVFEVSYKDDYENGEVDGTFSCCKLSTSRYDDEEHLKKAVEDFRRTYCHADSELYLEDGFIYTDFMAVPSENGYGWRKLTDEEADDWERGVFNEVYNVEWQMRISKVEEIDSSSVISIVGDIFDK